MEKLAIDGGVPVRQTMLPYGRQSVDEADIAAVVEVLRGDWLTTGPKVAEFEAAWALTEAIILRLRDEVAQRGSKLVVVLIAAPVRRRFARTGASTRGATGFRPAIWRSCSVPRCTVRWTCCARSWTRSAGVWTPS